MEAVIALGAGELSSVEAAAEREWLVTNGLGGYASGTVANLRTRGYHGLLVAALNPPVGRTLLLAKFDATAYVGGKAFPLYTNRWADGTLEPAAALLPDRFWLEGTTPVWVYALPGGMLEKCIWMAQGENTTYVSYRWLGEGSPLVLTIRALAACRDHHGIQQADAWQPRVEAPTNGIRIRAGEERPILTLRAPGAVFTPHHDWLTGFYLSVESFRGLNPVEDLLNVTEIRAEIPPGESLVVVASVESDPPADGAAAWAARRAYEADRLARSGLSDTPDGIRHLALAADQFVVQRPLPDAPDGRSVIAGYHWFGDWGRDTMIALPGLALAVGRAEDAATILRTFARYVDRGMLPNRFPEVGETPEYNTVDATLWYFEAVRATHAATGDDLLLRALFPTLAEIVAWHIRGTRYGILADPADGLLAAGEDGTQLTWMDAKAGDWVVTPRHGKPVEIAALWHNALRIMAAFAVRLGEDASPYHDWAARAQRGFARFWNDDAGYLYDVLDGPDGPDPALRPNQLFAVSLPHSPLDEAQQRAVVDACTRHLLTPVGLRSLSPEDPAYIGRYGGDQRTRDAAYHQGTVWAWLIGPYASAHLRAYGDRAYVRSLLAPLLAQLTHHGVGSLSEIFEGDPPHAPRGCIAQAWSVAEVLRLWREIAT